MMADAEKSKPGQQAQANFTLANLLIRVEHLQSLTVVRDTSGC